MKTLTRYRLSVLAATGVVAVGVWMLVSCSKQLTGNETGAPVEVALPALVIEPSQALFFGSAAGNPDGAPTQEASPNSDLFSVQMLNPTATTKADTTPTKAATALSNVWVLQFDGGGTTRACVYVGTVNAGSNILATLESGEGYSVWVVANGPGNGSFTTSNPASLSDFESKLLYTGNTTSDSQIPLCGKIENVTVLKNGQLLVGNNNATVPSVLLRRAQARVDMILEYDVDGAVFDGAWLYNVPTGACYGLLESAADGFPEAASGNFSYTEGFADGAVHAQGTQNANSTYTWYMGDNRRGTNSSILFEVQKHQANAPQYATYIRIKGHESADETKYLFHDVYLGKTKTSDFNVLRNWSYTFRVRIGGTLAQQKALTVDDPRVSAGTLQTLESVSVSPDPNSILRTGGEYTITIEGVWSGEIPVRILHESITLDEGSITYNAGSKGGSTTLTVPEHTGEYRRSVIFQYKKYGNWITITSGYQQGTAIDVGGTILLEYPVPEATMTWSEAASYCNNKETSEGGNWRLPTANELHFFWCIAPSLQGDQLFPENSYFWSSTKNSANNIVHFHTATGHINTYVLEGYVPSPTDTKFRVRCVKAAERDLTTAYPKISKSSDGYGDYIVTVAENDAGWPSAVLHAQRLSTSVTGDEQSTDNRISRKFRIQNSYPSEASITQGTALLLGDALNYCNTLNSIQYHGFNNWRLPTQRESQLLFAIGASNSVEIGAKDFTENPSGTLVETKLVLNYLISYGDFLPYYQTDSWSSTAISTIADIAGEPNRAWGMIFNGSRACEIGMTNIYGAGFQARCIRDEW